MRISRVFGQTLHDSPAAAEVVSHQLLMRPGFSPRPETSGFDVK
jgi:prolyl-tRNA synthetase